MGIEPTPSAWKAEVLPLNYTRQMTQILRTFAAAAAGQTGGGGRIRTFEGISRQIYSLLPLAAWVPLRRKSRIYSGRSGVLSMRSGDSPAWMRRARRQVGNARPAVARRTPRATTRIGGTARRKDEL